MDDAIKHYSDKLAYEIDSADLKSAWDARENIVIVDARSRAAYAAEHIEGAINIPHREMSAETTRQIDRNALVVTYCDWIGCNASTKGALNMAKLGFRVRELIGGVDWWKRDGYPTHGQAMRKRPMHHEDGHVKLSAALACCLPGRRALSPRSLGGLLLLPKTGYRSSAVDERNRRLGLGAKLR